MEITKHMRLLFHYLLPIILFHSIQKLNAKTAKATEIIELYWRSQSLHNGLNRNLKDANIMIGYKKKDKLSDDSNDNDKKEDVNKIDESTVDNIFLDTEEEKNEISKEVEDKINITKEEPYDDEKKDEEEISQVEDDNKIKEKEAIELRANEINVLEKLPDDEDEILISLLNETNNYDASLSVFQSTSNPDEEISIKSTTLPLEIDTIAESTNSTVESSSSQHDNTINKIPTSLEIQPFILVLKTKSSEQPKIINQNILLSTTEVYLTSVLYEQIIDIVNFNNVTLTITGKATADGKKKNGYDSTHLNSFVLSGKVNFYDSIVLNNNTIELINNLIQDAFSKENSGLYNSFLLASDIHVMDTTNNIMFYWLDMNVPLYDILPYMEEQAEHQTNRYHETLSSAKSTIIYSSNKRHVSYYFVIVSSTFFISIFICITILLWKNCKSPVSKKNCQKDDAVNNTNERNKNMIVINHDMHNDNQSFISDVTCTRSEYIFYSSNDNHNIDINESYSTYITAPSSEFLDEPTLSQVDTEISQKQSQYDYYHARMKQHSELSKNRKYNKFEDDESASVPTAHSTSDHLCIIS